MKHSRTIVIVLAAAAFLAIAGLANGLLDRSVLAEAALDEEAVAGTAVDRGQCDPDIQSDQRGLPRLQGAACDIGAVEVKANVGPVVQSVFLPMVKR